MFQIGCGGYHLKQYRGPKKEKSEIGIITTDDTFLSIVGFDGKQIDIATMSNMFNALMWGRFPRTISVLPGKHSFLPCFQHPYGGFCAKSWIDVKAGQSYIVRHKQHIGERSSVEFWIEIQDDDEKTMHQYFLGL